MGWKYYKKFNNIKEILIMDYKNKYNEALERARELSKTITGANYEYIFPELKEDEDELTWLKKYISEEAYYLSMDIRDCEDRLKLQKLQKSLAWLEKQGEQKPVWSEYDERILKTIIIGIKNEMFSDVMREEYQRIPNTNKNYHQIRIDWLKSIEQRLKGWDGERKQLITLDHFEDKGDMVEPKFKIGDKITEKNFDECGCGTVIDIKDGKYYFDDGNFIWIKEQGLWKLVEQNPTENIIMKC